MTTPAPRGGSALDDAGEAERRVLRIIYLSIGIGGLVYLGVGFGKAAAQIEAMEHGWGLVAYLLAAGGPVVLATTSLWLPLRILNRIAGAYALVFLVVMVTFPLFARPPLPDDGSPWTNDLMAIPAIALAIGARQRTIWPYVVVTGITSGVIRSLTAPDEGLAVAGLDLLYNTFFDTVFVAITLVSRSSARRLDEAAAAAQLKTSREAETTARVQQRIRIDALVHDHVLSALLIASRADDVPTPALRTLAATTLATLSEDALPPSELLSGDEFVGRLRSSVSSQSSGIEFEMSVDEARIPSDIAQALLEATAEALRNSLRHAGQGRAEVTRRVSVRTATSGIEIGVTDDGVGFNSRRIPPERLGVRVSILNRMSTLPGGYADVDSGRGTGTRVTIGWRSEMTS